MEVLAASQPVPAWHAAGPNRPVGAWCAVDVWDSERVLFIDYDGPVPHTLMAHIGEVGGTLVDKLALLTPHAAHASAARTSVSSRHSVRACRSTRSGDRTGPGERRTGFLPPRNVRRPRLFGTPSSLAEQHAARSE